MSEDAASSQEPVRYEITGAVATITLNRPDEMNALDTPTKEALLAALRSAAQDEQVRAVVLTGSGRETRLARAGKDRIADGILDLIEDLATGGEEDVRGTGTARTARV